jgi:phage baseplate assembly protein W
MATQTQTYRDLDMSFTKHPVTGDVAVKVGDQAIIRAVRNLVFTGFYERPFHPEIGSGVRQLLFELVDPVTAIRIKKAIEEVIANFEPRVRVKEIVVQADVDQNGFECIMQFYILNSTTPTVTTVFLERVR